MGGVGFASNRRTVTGVGARAQVNVAMTRAYLAAVALRVRRDFAVGIHVRSGLRFPEGSPRGVDARRASSTFQRGSAHAERCERSLARFSFVIRPGMPKREGVGDLSPQWK